LKSHRTIQIGIFFGLTAIILGAFGAHALKESLPQNSLESFQTGIRYQMYHAFLLLLLGFFKNRFKERYFNIASYSCIIGVVFFSGSIYLLSTKAITELSVSFLGPVTPIGGALLIVSWICLLIGLRRNLD